MGERGVELQQVCWEVCIKVVHPWKCAPYVNISLIKASADKCSHFLDQCISNVGSAPKDRADDSRGKKKILQLMLIFIFISWFFNLFWVYVMSRVERLKQNQEVLWHFSYEEMIPFCPLLWIWIYFYINRVWQREDYATPRLGHKRPCSLYLVCWNICPGKPGHRGNHYAVREPKL